MIVILLFRSTFYIFYAKIVSNVSGFFLLRQLQLEFVKSAHSSTGEMVSTEATNFGSVLLVPSCLATDIVSDV